MKNDPLQTFALKSFSESEVFEELKAREKILHHPHQYGKTQQDVKWS